MMVTLQHPEALAAGLVALLAYIYARATLGRRAWRGLIYLHNPLASRVSVSPRGPGWLVVAVEALAILALAASLSGPVLVYEVVVEEAVVSETVFDVPPRPGLVLVIDTSGSMGGWKIDAVKRAASSLVEGLDPRIDVGIVAFSERVEEAVPPASDREVLLSVIEALEAGGGTMYSYPLAVAMSWLSVYRDFGLPAAVVLLSDGVPADGSLAMEVVREMASMGIVIHGIYAGEGEGAGFLRGLAESTGGHFYEAADAEELIQAFEDVGRRVNSSLVVRTSIDAVAEVRVEVERPLAPVLAASSTLLALLSSLLRYRASGLLF